ILRRVLHRVDQVRGHVHIVVDHANPVCVRIFEIPAEDISSTSRWLEIIDGHHAEGIASLKRKIGEELGNARMVPAIPLIGGWHAKDYFQWFRHYTSSCTGA